MLKRLNSDVDLREAERRAKAEGTVEAWRRVQQLAGRQGDVEAEIAASRAATELEGELEAWQEHEGLRIQRGLDPVELADTPWRQIDGDISPEVYGGWVGAVRDEQVYLTQITPVRDAVGDAEAADVGLPFWADDYTFLADDLALSNPRVLQAIERDGHLAHSEFAAWEPLGRALFMANAGGPQDNTRPGWADEVLPAPAAKIAWHYAKGKLDAFAGDYWEQEEQEFRREVLGDHDDDDYDEESGDVTTTDYETWFQHGSLYHRGDEESLRARFEEDGFYPSVFFVDDHGGMTQIVWGDDAEPPVRENSDADLRRAERRAQSEGTFEAHYALERQRKREGLDAVEVPETKWDAPWHTEIPGESDMYLVRGDGDSASVLKIQSTVAWAGEEAAREYGYPFWVQSFEFEAEDLALSDDTPDMIARADVGPHMDEHEYAKLGALERALFLAEISGQVETPGSGPAYEEDGGYSENVLPYEEDLADAFREQHGIGDPGNAWAEADAAFDADVLGEEEEHEHEFAGGVCRYCGEEEGLYTYVEDRIGGIAIYGPQGGDSIAYLQSDESVGEFHADLRAIDEWWAEEDPRFAPPYDSYEEHLSDFLSRYDIE